MGKNIAQKIIQEHLLAGEMICGNEIAVRIDQTLTQDSTGTMAYLQLEALEIDRVKTNKSVAYIDHNTLQSGPENADDHLYIQSVAARHGIYLSKPGNGICHQVHLERIAVPGMTLLGSDSHTPTAGGMGMLAIGAGGLSVAVAMAGEPYYLTMPAVCRVVLTGTLAPWVSAKDIILAVLQQCTVKGGVNKIFEYAGEGIAGLSVPERATITNMGAELGATTSIFPSDEITRSFLAAQGRTADWSALHADPTAEYDEEIKINISDLVPLAARPHSPDNVAPVKDIGPIEVNQVIIGSCTNSSLQDMLKAAHIVKNKTVHPEVSFVIAPGSRQVLTMLSDCGALCDLVNAGARVLECACGPCIGMGQSPSTNAVSLRTINRNFEGRSGTASADVYLVSPETAAVSALTGRLTDPREYGQFPDIKLPDTFTINDSLILTPPEARTGIKIKRGPNIKPFPVNSALPDTLSGKILIKLGDNITTDHIMPSYAKLLPYRSNIPYLSDYCLSPCDPDFPVRARQEGGGIILGGSNYGQGSSREHAALAPLQLGITTVIAKSFARIHMENLINNGILTLVLENEHDYDLLALNDTLEIRNAPRQVRNESRIMVTNVTRKQEIPTTVLFSERQKEMILAGGLLNAIKQKT
ncbi:MAG: aconitate hydratase [Deltaproteobacteria bacterium]|nr:aconitate hydratase [Deltaproteobacteria bacterium]